MIENSGGIIRVSKRDTWVVLDKYFLDEDNRLSLRAKGLLAYLLAKPDSWRVYVSDLVNRVSDGRKAIYAALKELEGYGYITREINRGNNGKIMGYTYTIYERPQTLGNPPFDPKGDMDNPDVEKPYLPGRHAAKATQVFKISTNNKKDKIQQQPISDHRSVVDRASDEKDVVVESAPVQIISTPEPNEKQEAIPKAGAEKKAANAQSGSKTIELKIRPNQPVAAAVTGGRPREVRKVNNYAPGRGMVHAVGSNARLRGIAADPAVQEAIGYAAERGVCNINGNLALTLLTKAGGSLDRVKGAIDRFAKFASTTPVHKPNKVLIDALDWPPDVTFDRDVYKRHLSEEREKRLTEKEKKYEDLYLS